MWHQGLAHCHYPEMVLTTTEQENCIPMYTTYYDKPIMTYQDIPLMLHAACWCYSILELVAGMDITVYTLGGGPRVVVSTAAFHARVRGSVPGLGGLKETKLFLPHPRVKVSIVGSLRDREVACSASDRQGSISNPVSGGQCHLNHLTILRRFSWPSLAYMCTKVA